MKFSSPLFVAISATTLLVSCSEPAPVDPDQQAANLAQNAIIVDTHIDVPFRLNNVWVDVSEATEGGDFDYPRAVAGGLNAPFMSIYTPASMGDGAEATANANAQIDMIEEIVVNAPDKFAIATSVADVKSQFATGLISLPLGMENGSPIAGDLANLQHFYDRGIRYITLTHSLANHISDSSYDENRPWAGLSPFGEEVVQEMNRLGIMVDVSHVSDDAFWDTLGVSKTPLVASHSSARHFTLGFERNMSDDMIKAMAEKGGVIMINFGSSFLTEKANSSGYYSAYTAYLEENNLEANREVETAFRAEFFGEAGYPYATLDEVLDHFDHVVEIAGIDYVGIGSDYDGVGDSLPIDLKDVSQFPNLIEGLLGRGYTEEDVRKILSGNILRVWQAVEDYASASAN